MNQEEINQIEDPDEKDRAQRKENQRVTDEIYSMSASELAAFIKARGYNGGL